MDLRVIEAFYRCLYESVKDEDLPMEPSDFQKDHFSLYQSEEFKIDLRLSSYKKIGKLLEKMTKQGVISYTEIKGISHKLITKVHRSNEIFTTYTP